ncbi:MAG: hypothetical protein M1820_007847 [Bogoriella megaspora]|nr:MAG: hypothetical protein M1820_007847 [Bogoriella megaspora]
MKLFTFLTATLPALALAAPHPQGAARVVEDGVSKAKRAAAASVTDAASIGYATLNGGTKGGAGGSTTTVSSLAALTSAVTGDDPKIIVISGTISGAAQIRVGSNKSIIGKNSSAKLVGVGFYVNKVKNVIIRNLSISKVLAENGDAIGIQASSNVWVDHVDVSSDRDHDKDFYDGLIDVTHASEYVTISNTYFHDHWKASLVGHSDNNGAEDTGHLTVTYANNYWRNINSRAPSFRFGTGHVFNSYFETVNDGINTRDGAQLLVESNQFVGSGKPLYSTDNGFAVSKGNDFGSGSDEAGQGTLNSVPYSYTTLGSAKVKAAVVGTAGATLSF